MTLLDVLLVLLVAGVLAWLISKAPIVPDPYKQVAIWILLAVVVLYLLSQFGAFNRLLNHRIGSLP